MLEGAKMKKNKKVLIVGSDSSVKGGITTVINSLLNHDWECIEMELLPTYIEGNAIEKIIFFLKAILKYIVKLIKKDFDIVHIHMSYNGSFYRKLLIVKLSNLFNKKIILHLHGSEFEEFYNNNNKYIKKLIKNIFDKSTYVIVLGERWNKIIKSISPMSNVKIFNNAVTVPSDTVKWNKNDIKVLFLGVLIKRKGIYELIESINILRKKGIIEKNKLKFIIGGTGKEEASIMNLINKYNIQDCVEMVGWVDGKQKTELLKQSQIFVLPSYNEGLPMAILEAMSFGIPTISTNVGSVEEVVKNGYNGIIINPGNVEALSSAINKLSYDEAKWKRYSINSKLIIEDYYDEVKYFDKMTDTYIEIMS